MIKRYKVEELLVEGVPANECYVVRLLKGIESNKFDIDMILESDYVKHLQAENPDLREITVLNMIYNLWKKYQKAQIKGFKARYIEVDKNKNVLSGKLTVAIAAVLGEPFLYGHKK